MKNKRIPLLTLICVIISIAVMAFPDSYVMRWASPNPDDIITNTFSYFSLTPYGYANFFPLLTAVTAIICAVFLILNILLSRFSKTALILIAISILTSVFSVFMSYEITACGIIITAFLSIAAVLKAMNKSLK